MKRDEIEVGGTYLAKAGSRTVEVRIEAENGKGGWNAVSLATAKPVRIKDARHLRPAKPAVEATPAKADAAPAPRAAGEGRKKAAKPKAKTATEKVVAEEPAAEEAPAEKAPAGKPAKAMSCLDAAAKVLRTEGRPMPCKAMVEAMAARGLWSTTAPTPAATLYSAILREMKKGEGSRFRKTGRGHFELNTNTNTHTGATA